MDDSDFEDPIELSPANIPQGLSSVLFDEPDSGSTDASKQQQLHAAGPAARRLSGLNGELFCSWILLLAVTMA